MIKLTEEKGVNAFIQEHKFLVPVITDVAELVHTLFGCDDSNINLTLEKDSGCPNCSYGAFSQLWFIINTRKSFEAAHVLLEQLDEKFWLDQPYEIRRCMNIDLKYID